MWAKLLNGLGRVIPLREMVSLHQGKLLVVLYHLVCDDYLPQVRPLYAYRSVPTLDADIETFLKHYIPITLPELIAQRHTLRPFEHPRILLTFDDGLRQCADIVAPMLAAKGIPAAFFLCPPLMDNRQLMYRHQVALLLHRLEEQPQLAHAMRSCFQEAGYPAQSAAPNLRALKAQDQPLLERLTQLAELDIPAFLATQRPYMTWAQAREMQRMGFDFGAHSLHHWPYQGLTEAEQLEETRASLDIVQQQLALPYRAFAFPFYDHGLPRTLLYRLVRGPQRIADLTLGTSGLKRDVHRRSLQRVDMERWPLPATSILKQAYLRAAMRTLALRNRMKRA